jgi:hypothetical protein
MIVLLGTVDIDPENHVDLSRAVVLLQNET